MTKFETDSNAPVVAYVSKMVAVPESQLPQNKKRTGATLSAEEARELARKKRAEFAKARAIADANGDINNVADSLRSTTVEESGLAETEEEQKSDPEHLIGFARLYSGTLTVGDEVYVLPPKFTPASPHAHPEPQKVTVTALYLLMGRELESLTSVPAGVVFGVAGLEGHILKSGTLCSQSEGSVNLAGVNLGSQPIVRVALEPENPGDLDKMVRGLRLLEQSDPCAEYEVLESGEHVIRTAGELHLERCLKDLRERFAKCEIQAGEPIVPYRESIVSATEMNPPKSKELPRGTVVGITTSKQVTLRVRVYPLPVAVIEFLIRNMTAIKTLYAERKAEEDGSRGTDTPLDIPRDQIVERDGLEDAGVTDTGNVLSLAEFKARLKLAFLEAKGDAEIWRDVVDNISAFGPRRTGANLFIDATHQQICGRLYGHIPIPHECEGKLTQCNLQSKRR